MGKSFIFIFFFLFLPLKTLYGQGNHFSVDRDKGCAPLTVQITPHQENNNIFFYYGDGASGTDRSHEYPSPGTYKLVIAIGEEGVTPITDTIKIYVYPFLPIEKELFFCNPLQLNGTLKQNYPVYQIAFGDGNSEIIDTNRFTHNYALAKEYVIDIKGGFINHDNNFIREGCGEVKEKITVPNEITPPVLQELHILEDKKINIKASLSPFSIFELHYSENNSPFKPLKTLYPQTELNNIEIPDFTFSNPYCFQISNEQRCALTTVLTSKPLCVFTFQVKAENGYNEISWADQPSITEIEKVKIFVNNTPVTETQYREKKYIHENILCHQQYCYTIQAQTKEKQTLHLPPQCVMGMKKNIYPQIKGYASIIDDVVKIGWEEVGIDDLTLFIERSDSQTHQFESIDEIDMGANEYWDTHTGFKQATLCYQVYYGDACKNTAPRSQPFCTLRINGFKKEKDNLIKLFLVENYADIFSDFFLEITNDKDNTMRSIRVNPTTNTYEFLDTFDKHIGKRTYYQLKTTLPELNKEIYSNKISLPNAIEMQIPTAFSPNNDNLNDIFKIESGLLDSFEMQIFNTWGNKVFQTSVIDMGWDGTIEGKPAKKGTYYFIIKGKDLLENYFEKKGIFLLLR